MVVNGSKCGEKPLLPFFFELWSNNKKTAERHKILCLFRRFYLFRTLSLFAVEHVLGKDEVAGSNPANSSKENHQIWWFFYYICAIYCVPKKSGKCSQNICRRIADDFWQKRKRGMRLTSSQIAVFLNRSETP